MTVKDLLGYVQKQIDKGNGDKEILISSDDEGNEFHGLYYQFTDDYEQLKQFAEYGLFHDCNDPANVVVLG